VRVRSSSEALQDIPEIAADKAEVEGQGFLIEVSGGTGGTRA
jgi:hypothetical protein